MLMHCLSCLILRDRFRLWSLFTASWFQSAKFVVEYVERGLGGRDSAPIQCRSEIPMSRGAMEIWDSSSGNQCETTMLNGIWELLLNCDSVKWPGDVPGMLWNCDSVRWPASGPGISLA